MAGGDPDAQFNGRKLDQPYDVPDVALTATDGASYSLASDREEPLTLVFFGYTHCPTCARWCSARCPPG